MITVSALEPNDRAAWQELFAGYHAFYERTWPAERFDEAWREFQRGDRIHALGARLDGRLVGIAHFLAHASTSSPDVCYLQDLFTVPQARGQGIGGALIAKVYEEARRTGSSRVYWHTQETNNVAQNLYDKVAEKTGFIVYRKQL